MRTRFGYCQARAALALRGAGSGANTIEVRWVEVSGGTVDPGTGGRVGGTRTAKSGTLRALALQEPPTTVVRNYAEVEAGDLLLDTDAAGTVEISGTGVVPAPTTTLDALAALGPVFVYCGRSYSQKKVGAALSAAWDVASSGQKLFRTILLRPET